MNNYDVYYNYGENVYRDKEIYIIIKNKLKKILYRRIIDRKKKIYETF